MKKVILLVAVIWGFTVVGPAHGAQVYSVVTGPVGGPMYAISGAWAEIVNKNLKGYQLTNQVGGGSVYTMKILANGQADFAMVGNDVAMYGYKGTEAFAGKPVKDARAVAALYLESFQIVVKASSSIKVISDLKGKRVTVGPPASGTQLASERLLPILGLKMTDFKKLELGFNESAEYLRDGNADAAVYQTGIPYGPVVDISVIQPVNVLTLPKNAIQEINKKFPFYVSTTIPKTTYKGMEQDAQSVAVKMLLLASSKVANGDVYAMTKALFDHLDRMRAGHKMGESITLEGALVGVTIPLHPGAEKYYREKGLLK
jgi:TRAP transporter TAXI family solute receptor